MPALVLQSPVTPTELPVLQDVTGNKIAKQKNLLHTPQNAGNGRCAQAQRPFSIAETEPSDYGQQYLLPEKYIEAACNEAGTCFTGTGFRNKCV